MRIWASVIILLFACLPVVGGEIDYLEDFVLAKDRSEALKQLIPGTETYYYYHCLHYQNTEQFEKVDELLKAWIKRHKETQLVREIQNRQALLTYGQNPDAALAFLRTRLSLRFDHQRILPGQKPDLPTQLDPARISREALLRIALAQHTNLQGVEDSALQWLISTELNGDRRRHLLERLQRPDYPNLVKLVADDLEYRYSRGFGSLGIHRGLLIPQLEELLKRKPELLQQTNFVNIYMSKLRPSDDTQWQHDPETHRAYLERLETFVDRLDPVHNSLKAHVLYRRLDLERSQGIYDKPRFMKYIQLPRNVNYINPRYLETDNRRRFAANLSQDFGPVTRLPIVGNDEPLVRDYLHHFFVKETTYKPYEAYLHDTYLKRHFAETKIVHGLGEPEQWYSLITPTEYRALKDRIDIDFAADNREFFGRGEAVSLDLYVKNVPSLIVKVYEVNTQNYYRQVLKEVNTDINLDGLVANQETTHQYAEPPVRRVRRHFEFPGLNRAGVFVIDFIGNGKSSRAVIRKGQLQHLVRSSVAGQVFTVLNEDAEQVKDATLWMAGHEYTPDKDGTILVPFSNRPSRQAIVLSQGDFASLDYFQHESENYELRAGFYVDREALLQRKQAKLVVRPQLRLNGNRAPFDVLENVRLVLTSTDRDGVSSTKEVDDFKLLENQESVYEFHVPARLASIQFELRARVQNLSQNKKQDLVVREQFALNQIDTTQHISDVHLAHSKEGYRLELFGKSGEPLEERAVQVVLKHRDFRSPVHVTLKTNPAGIVQLGQLEDIHSLTATGPNGVSHPWVLVGDRHSYPQTLHGRVGSMVAVPYMDAEKEPSRDKVSLLEVRGSTFVADRFESLSIAKGMLQIQGLPAGDYDLKFKPHGPQMRIRLTAGDERHGYVLGEYRQLQIRDASPLQISAIEAKEKEVTIQLQNVSPGARVHVFGTRYEPAYSAYALLDRIGRSEPYGVLRSKRPSWFAEGRNIGDEYRYIIDRKYARKFPGNMLDRPSLLLNPWAIRKTQTGDQQAQGGDAFAPNATPPPAPSARPAERSGEGASNQDFANLDFLGEAAAVLLNLEADKQGRVSVPRELLGAHSQLHVVAVDARQTAYRRLVLPDTPMEADDLRLLTGLDPKQHYSQQKQVSVIPKDELFTLGDITTGRFESYDSLARVYNLYLTLSGDAKLNEFEFVLRWPKLEAEKKRDYYSRFACHELSYFLFKKDPEFFEAVIRPYLKNKKDKTFLDQWLIAQDLQVHLQPWNHAQLNLAEQVFLAHRIDGESEATALHVKHLFELVPPDVDRFNFLFNTAIQGRALEHDAELAEEQAAAKKQAGEKFAQSNRQLSTRALGGRFGGGLGGGGAMGPGAGAVPQAAPAAKPNAPALRDELKRKSRGVADAKEGLQDLRRRGQARQLYRQLDKTQEWVENNYYKLPIEQQNADLVKVNAFWNDYAQHDPRLPFQSVHLAEAASNFTEMMLALAVLDLPFESPEHDIEYAKSQMQLKAAGSIVIFHEEIKLADKVAMETPILVSQNFFQDGDRFRYVNNERVDKYADEFLVHTVYGCQVVVTNPTSSRQKLDLLLQIPEGALPVKNGHYTRSVHADLQPYRTQTVEYYFYFPAAGNYTHYPVHVSKNDTLLAYAEPQPIKVVDEPTKLDTESWAYVSQNGSPEEVLNFLKTHNLERIELDKIAWRMGDAEFFRTVTDLLAARHVYNHTLWSYSIKHNRPAAIQQYLQYADAFVNASGRYLESPLLTIDPVIRKTYQHMEYRPLVNARAHQLGRRRQILNDRFFAQYHELLKVQSYRRELTDIDLMGVTYYLLLQDRIDEALEFFGQVNAKNLDTQLQYDYFAAYLDFFSEGHEIAGPIAEKYVDFPVDRWRQAFDEIRGQLRELETGKTEVIDPESHSQTQTQLAATESNFEFQVESRKVQLSYQNLDRITINYYLMDIELLFSRNPFVQQFSGQFSFIRPNQSDQRKLPNGKSTIQFDLPAELHNKNVLVEITGGGQVKTQAYYSNSLALQLVQNYGQLRVRTANPGKPIPKAYVKVYAKMRDGSVKFFKDGYTDLRGRFDYTSLNTNELDFVDKFSLLVMTDQHGAIVREADPPKR